MFTNIGKKIKTLAKIICWFGIIVSIILALASFASVNYSTTSVIAALICALIILVIGCLCSWLSCFMMYAFGDLADNTQKIRELLEKTNNQQ